MNKQAVGNNQQAVGLFIADAVRCRQFTVENKQGQPFCEIRQHGDAMRFVLRDTQGSERILIGISPDGTAELSVVGSGFCTAISLTANEIETILAFYDGSHHKRVEIGALSHGDAGIHLYNLADGNAAYLNVVNSRTSFGGFGPDGTMLFHAPVFQAGAAQTTPASFEPAADLRGLCWHIELYNSSLCGMEHNVSTLHMLDLVPHQNDAEFVAQDKVKRKQTLEQFQNGASLASILRGAIELSPCYAPSDWQDGGPTSAQAMLAELGLGDLHFIKRVETTPAITRV